NTAPATPATRGRAGARAPSARRTRARRRRRSARRWSPRLPGTRGQDERRPDDEQDARGDVPDEVVGQQCDVVADLVQPEQLVLDQAVVELERPGADEQPADEPAHV